MANLFNFPSLISPCLRRCSIIYNSQRNIIFRYPKYVNPNEDTAEFIRSRQTNVAVEYIRLINHFATQMRMIRSHCMDERTLPQTVIHTEVYMDSQMEEHTKRIALNDIENKKSEDIRNERLAAEEIASDIYTKSRVERTDARYREYKELSLSRLEEMKVLAGTFINKEDLEKEILKAMDNPVDYNFSIDFKGNCYIGKSTTPQNANSDQVEEMEVTNDGLYKNDPLTIPLELKSVQ